jgi:CRP-like cAMP-binding protein
MNLEESDIAKILSGSPVFKGLSAESLEKIIAGSRYKIRNYDKDSIVKLSGEKQDSLMIILHGKVQAQMIDYSGKSMTISDLSAPLPIAPAFIYARKNEMPVAVRTLTDAAFIVFSKDSFTDILQQHRIVLLNFLTVISDQTGFLSEKIRFLTFKSIKSKLANFMLKESKQGVLHSFELSATQQELADYFGVTRPALARVFGEMEREGLIAVSKKVVSIRDFQALVDLSE